MQATGIANGLWVCAGTRNTTAAPDLCSARIARVQDTLDARGTRNRHNVIGYLRTLGMSSRSGRSLHSVW